MKDKLVINTGEQFIYPFLTHRCWKAENKKRKNSWQKQIEKYRNQIDTTLAGMAIGLMLLTGIWLFLVQLAESLG